jgi:hypothetical protein
LPLEPREAHPSEFYVLAQPPNLPQQLGSTQVIVRFGLRMTILIVFATLGSIGFGRSLAALLWMSTILGVVIAAIKREPPFGEALNHWDETVAYAALCCLVSGFNQAAPF